MYKTIYNEIVYEYTQYIYKEYGEVNQFDRIYIIGLKTLTHIFKFLLLNNIDNDTIKIYCIKSYYYFCEFILQIQSKNIYSLNYTEASIFVYKKFIDISFPKNKNAISVNILYQMQQYSDIIIILLENYIILNNKDIYMIQNLKPIIHLLIPITNFYDLDNCISIIRTKSINTTNFINILTNVLTCHNNLDPIKNIGTLSSLNLYPLQVNI
jgi:hypothetical protein